MNKEKNWNTRATLIFTLVLASIFFVEFGILAILQHLLYPNAVQSNLLGASALSLVLLPILYFYFLKPLRNANIDLQKFKLAVENASDHIIITDSDGKIIFANKAAEKITGYSQEEIIGKTPRLWGGQMPLEFYKNLWKTIKLDKKVFEGEISNRRKSGQNYIAEIHIGPVLDERNRILFFVGIERDITKAKEIDRAKSEFVSLASHQLRTPLSAINWYTEMLMDGDVGEMNEKQKDYLQEIYGASKRMAALVSALLNVSRIELGTFAIEPKLTDVVELTKSVIKDMSLRIRKDKQEVIENYGEGIKTLNVDPNLMRIIIENLFFNSVKYTKDDGEIKISIEKTADAIVLSVADNGYGIPKDEQVKIFKKFFRADNIREKETDGNGLGLYMVKEVAEKAGGKIWFESEENKGTTFHVSIPLAGMINKPGEKKLV